MTNVFGHPEKVSRMKRLFQIGIESLEKQGWTVERIKGFGKASVRRIKKGSESHVISIRTTQDTWIAFPRTKDDTAWVTLSEVDKVVAVSVDDKLNPQSANVHMIDGDEMRSRFERTYAARKAANHVIQPGRGVWVSLYDKEDTSVPSTVGAGAGLSNPAIAKVPLQLEHLENASEETEEVMEAAGAKADDEAPLTIPEAKRRLALTFGVEPANIKITVVDL